MLTGKFEFVLLLELTLAVGSICGAQQAGESPAANAQVQATPEATVVLKEGTRVQLRLAETLDSERGASHASHKRGALTGMIEGVEFRVFPEVRVDDLVVIERGAQAWGTAELKQKASFGRNGSVRITALRALAITGAEVPLRGNAAGQGSPDCYAEGCLALALGVAGGDAVMPAGTEVEAYAAKDVSFDTAAVKKAMAEIEQSKTPQRAARGDKAIVYIYRCNLDETLAAARDQQDSDCVSSSDTSTVSLDGRELVSIAKFECVALTLTQGKHAIGADRSVIEIDLMRGEDYYLHISGGSMKQLKLVSRGEGEEHIDPLRPVCEALSEPL